MESQKIVCLTTFRQGDLRNTILKIRSEVFLDTANKILESGFSLVVIYTETQESFMRRLNDLGAIVLKQKTFGMGNIRREAIMESIGRFSDSRYFCWLEPEKPDLIRFIVPLIHLMEKDSSDFGIFNRIEMTSYPPEQAYYYLFCRSVASGLVCFDFDYAFGPMILTPLVIPFFLDYSGVKYGDMWDSILIPRLRIIKQGVKFSILPVNFQNDKRMTRVETGNPNFILKRVQQFNNVIPSLLSEWKLLNELR